MQYNQQSYMQSISSDSGYIEMECAAALVTNKIRVTMVFLEKYCCK
jgi:hypothetical protein